MDVVVTSRAESYRATRARGRAERRERSLARVPAEQRVDGSRVGDPLAHVSAARRTAVPLWLAASMGAHVVVFVLGAIAPASAASDPRSFEQSVEIVAPPPPKPDVPPAETAPPIPPPDRPIEPAPPVVTRSKPILQPEPPVPAPSKDEPPPDPIESPAGSPEPAATRPARRVVGLNLGSTVVGGSGTSFGIGNTRMGETSGVAADPGSAAAQGAAQFVPPRRTHEESAEYPPTLRAQNIEGEVVLKVELDATGHVSNVSVVRPSPHDAFNQAAVAAARRSLYAPALMNGAPVANTIQFTVRFRLKQ